MKLNIAHALTFFGLLVKAKAQDLCTIANGFSCPEAPPCQENVCLLGVCTLVNLVLGLPCELGLGDVLNLVLPCDDTQDTCDGFGNCIDRVIGSDSQSVCRPAVSECDVAETCDGVLKECPPDTFAPSNVECRAKGGECDAAEFCTGNSATCPDDTFAPANTRCGGRPQGGCDMQDTCDGAGACKAKIKPRGAVCRKAAGRCDIPETCDGVTKQCPSDKFKTKDTKCGNMRPAYCKNVDTCSGTNGVCANSGKEVPLEYTFKCGSVNYLCGNEVTGRDCDPNVATAKPSKAECDGMIAAVNNRNVNPHQHQCPNGSTIDTFAQYDCRGKNGKKCVGKCPGAPPNQPLSSCPMNKLTRNCAGKCKATRGLRAAYDV